MIKKSKIYSIWCISFFKRVFIIVQELTLQLKNRAAIDRIQFLSHSQFIPKSVSIEVGDVSSDRDNPDLNKAIFMPVGDISFLNGNEKGSTGRGRQLQTVEFGGGQNNTTKDMIKVTFVKFILKQNHFNRQNQYNQVSYRKKIIIHLLLSK